MTEQETLNKIHELNLLLADEIKRICEKYNIKYFMIAGTLLGAVRHKGFIPWDDDMDFGMLRKDYNKFVRICTKELDEDKFFLQTQFNTKNYAFDIGKLKLKGTIIEENFSKNTAIDKSIFVDIFPFDFMTENKFGQKLSAIKFYICRTLLWIKCGYGTDTDKKKFKYKLAKFISGFFSIKELKLYERKITSKYNDFETKYVVAFDGAYGVKKETLLKEWIFNLDNYKFENRVYPGIKDHDSYLSYFYGDYMTLPPEDKRGGHGRLKVDFGKYK